MFLGTDHPPRRHFWMQAPITFGDVRDFPANHRSVVTTEMITSREAGSTWLRSWLLFGECREGLPSHCRLEEPGDWYALQFFARDVQQPSYLVGCGPASRYVLPDSVKWRKLWAYGHLVCSPSSAPGSSHLEG